MKRPELKLIEVNKSSLVFPFSSHKKGRCSPWLSVSEEGQNYFLQNNEFLDILSMIIGNKEEDKKVMEQALTIILSLSSNPKFCDLILEKKCILENVFLTLTELKDKNHADLSCKLLCNMTREDEHCKKIWEKLTESQSEAYNIIEKLTNVLCKAGSSSDGYLGYISSLLCNLSQLECIHRVIKKHDFTFLESFLPFLKPEIPILLKTGIVGTIRNCCFDPDSHSVLLGNSLNLLPALLLPLAGNEEFKEEEMDQLPLDLQYLPDDKVREEDPSVRKMLIETLIQMHLPMCYDLHAHSFSTLQLSIGSNIFYFLYIYEVIHYCTTMLPTEDGLAGRNICFLCAKTFGREHLRNSGTYFIIRELYAWEPDKLVKLRCLDLIDILIKRENETNVDNLKDLDIPEKYVNEFEEINKEVLENF
ncbi:Protein HGH1 [Nymphon striatum]|nr:Protein HGH1 [Nymphon striatum]KAG1701250.1 Protein HGH1 [Nymphon striatum]